MPSTVMPWLRVSAWSYFRRDKAEVGWGGGCLVKIHLGGGRGVECYRPCSDVVIRIETQCVQCKGMVEGWGTVLRWGVGSTRPCSDVICDCLRVETVSIVTVGEGVQQTLQ